MSRIVTQIPLISPDTWHFRVFLWYIERFGRGEKPTQIGWCWYWFAVLFEAPLLGFVTYVCGALVILLALLIFGWIVGSVVSAYPTIALSILLVGIAVVLFTFLWLHAHAKGWAVERWTTNIAYVIARRFTTMKQRLCPIVVLPDY